MAAAAERVKTVPAVSQTPPSVPATRLPTPHASGGIGQVAVEDTRKSYSRDVLAAFFFPTSRHNLFTLLGGCVGLFVGGFIPFVSWLVVGWYAAFRFSVVEQAAAGEDDLPAVASVGDLSDFLEELIYPFFRWIGSWIVVLLPAYGYLVVANAKGWLEPNAAAAALTSGIDGMFRLAPGLAAGGLAPFVVLVCMGMFLWPIIVLCVALGGFSAVYRLDVIIPTVIRTFPAYLVTVTMVFGTEILKYVLSRVVIVAGMGGMLGSGLLLLCLISGISIYFEIVAMKLIGLYYHHFKHRFAWSWG